MKRTLNKLNNYVTSSGDRWHSASRVAVPVASCKNLRSTWKVLLHFKRVSYNRVYPNINFLLILFVVQHRFP